MDETKIDKIHQEEFVGILKMINASRDNALKSVNTELITLYWNIGKCIYEKIEKSNWGQSVVKQLSNYLLKKEPILKAKRTYKQSKEFYFRDS